MRKRPLINNNGVGIVDLEGCPGVTALMLVRRSDAVAEDMALQ
jgi:hypothetical protein